MAVCVFFGHRECPESVRPILRKVLVELIDHHCVDIFYVGNQGQFDSYVRRTLRELAKEYPHISYGVVLAYIPQGKNPAEDYCDAMLPEGIEAVHPKFAISWRNRWMLHRSDFVVTYITHTWGGAYQFAEKAKKLGKTGINLDGIA